MSYHTGIDHRTRGWGFLFWGIDMVQEKHGMTGSPEYKAWVDMIQRCTNPKNASYGRYGERGISVCDRWMTFVNFLFDMGFRPKGLTLEREDNEKGYSRENCMWATWTAQSRNVGIRSDNKTGAKGTYYSRRRNRFVATIRVDGREKHLGCFRLISQAAEARRQGEVKYWGK